MELKKKLSTLPNVYVCFTTGFQAYGHTLVLYLIVERSEKNSRKPKFYTTRVAYIFIAMENIAYLFEILKRKNISELIIFYGIGTYNG